VRLSNAQPANLLIFSNGTLRISDFGCAQAFDPKAPMQFTPPKRAPSSSLSSSSSTTSSAPMTTPLSATLSPWVKGTAGTEPFWPPEVCSGAGGDLRSADLWAVGCCLSCFAFGALPYNPALPTALLMDAIAETPPNLPPPLATPPPSSVPPVQPLETQSNEGKPINRGRVPTEAVAVGASSSSNSERAVKEWWSEPSAMVPECTPALLCLLLGDDDDESSTTSCSTPRCTGLLAEEPRQRTSIAMALSHSWFALVAEDAQLFEA